MKHLCKNCIFCNRIAKDSGYKTFCRLRPDEIVEGKVTKCRMRTTICIENLCIPKDEYTKYATDIKFIKI